MEKLEYCSILDLFSTELSILESKFSQGSLPLWLLRFTLILVATVAASILVTWVLLLVSTDSTIDHSLILDLAQLILTLINLGLVCIILLPQLFVSCNFVFKLLVLVFYLLLKIVILFIKLSKTVLQVLVWLLHNSKVLCWHFLYFLKAINIRLSFVNLRLQETAVHFLMMIFLLWRITLLG